MPSTSTTAGLGVVMTAPTQLLSTSSSASQNGAHRCSKTSMPMLNAEYNSGVQ